MEIKWGESIPSETQKIKSENKAVFFFLLLQEIMLSKWKITSPLLEPQSHFYLTHYNAAFTQKRAGNGAGKEAAGDYREDIHVDTLSTNTTLKVFSKSNIL